MKILIAFILGFVVATVGLSNLVGYADRQLNSAKDVVKENVK